MSEIWCEVVSSKSLKSNLDRRVSRGHRLDGSVALHNYLASIFTTSGWQSHKRIRQVRRSAMFRLVGDRR